MPNINYPIIFRYDDMTVTDGDLFPKHWGIKHLSDNAFETAESIHPEANFHWLIDSEAKLRTISLKGKHREWARPLRHICRLVRVQYEIADGRGISIGELKKLIEGTRLDEEKSLTPALNEFLCAFDDTAPFTKELFNQFMGGGQGEE